MGDTADPEASMHDYVSTACLHRLHDQCRQTCKFCQANCLCVCHRWRIQDAGSA